jgi:hypothetical protein
MIRLRYPLASFSEIAEKANAKTPGLTYLKPALLSNSWIGILSDGSNSTFFFLRSPSAQIKQSVFPVFSIPEMYPMSAFFVTPSA